MKSKGLWILCLVVVLVGVSVLVMAQTKENAAPEKPKSVAAAEEAKAKEATMIIEIGVESGKVYSVKEKIKGELKEVKPIKINDEKRPLTLGGKAITHIADHTVIQTHSSPGCVWYIYRGYYWQVCN